MTEASARIPSPRAPGRYRLALVCLGNICRSPMAHVVLEALVMRAGLADRVELMSAGTAGYHQGSPMDRRAAAALAAAGYDASRHRAQPLPRAWARDCDLMLVMDQSNLEDVLALTEVEQSSRLRLFREFDPRGEAADGSGADDVPDPYYGGDDGFEHVLAIVTRAAAVLVAQLAGELRS